MTCLPHANLLSSVCFELTTTDTLRYYLYLRYSYTIETIIAILLVILPISISGA